MEDDFSITIETWHKPDLGTQENVGFSYMGPPVVIHGLYRF